MSRGLHTTTVQTHADGLHRNRPHVVPIDRSVTFEAASADEHRRLFRTGAEAFYQRFGHPTLAAAGRKIAQLEGAEDGLVFSSGMGAIATSLLAVLRGGDHVVAHSGTFDQTRKLLEGPLASLGVATTFVDARDPAEVRRWFRPTTRVLVVDSPSNPLLDVIDIRALADARPRGVELFVDSTFASPVLQQPLALGATLALHSATKFLAGHSDLMAGAVAGRAELVGRIRAVQILLGTILDPQGAWLLLRGIKTLALRVERQSATALAVARYLARHPAVAEVRYPWLDGTREESLARCQMRGGGGVVTFRMVGGRDAAARLLDRLQLVAIATSLGGVETTAELPYDLDFDSDEGDSVGAGEHRGFIRLSVGLEDVEDLLGDIDRALA